MISGTIDAFLAAQLRLTVKGPLAQHDVDAFLDTGFNGFLSLPQQVLATLGLSPMDSTIITLGDGTIVRLPLYYATVFWDGRDRTVETDCVDGLCLVGMSLLEGHDVRLRVLTGGSVEIEAIP